MIPRKFLTFCTYFWFLKLNSKYEFNDEESFCIYKLFL